VPLQLLHNLLGYTIQHTSYLSSCGLLGLSSSIQDIGRFLSAIEMELCLFAQTIRLSPYPLVIWHSLSWRVWSKGANPFIPHRSALESILSDSKTNNLRLPPSYGRESFRCNTTADHGILYPDLYGWTNCLAQLCRLHCFGCIATLILIGAIPPITWNILTHKSYCVARPRLSSISKI